MNKAETIQEFYSRTYREAPEIPAVLYPKDIGHINVFARDYTSMPSPYSRKDFYKISLVLGKGILRYEDKRMVIDSPALLFTTPMVHYGWEATSTEQKGWFCLFTDIFLQSASPVLSLKDIPFFKMGIVPLFLLNARQVELIADILQKMQREISSNYIYKYDVLRNYLQLLIHEALKMIPVKGGNPFGNASYRIAAAFMELLERQFPIDSPENALKLKTAVDFAEHLNIHVNSLNRSIREATGRTTTEHIADRLIHEAKALLYHTDWNINEIAAALGFGTAPYFSNYFKKRVGAGPLSFRNTRI